MQIVHLECVGKEADYRREYPEFPIKIRSLRFSVDAAKDADWLAVTSNIAVEFATTVPWERRILLMMEASGHYPVEYLNQFGTFVSPYFIAGYRGHWHPSHTAHAAFFGIDLAGGPGLGYEALMAQKPREKRAAISAVVSTKSILPGHRRRLGFLRQLKRTLGDRLDIFGRGFHEIGDKADAILPYQYHLVLENTSMPDYWTEKLADAYLGYAFPIVSGPPNLDRWFPRESFEPIDLDNPTAAVETVLRVMDTDTFHHRIDAVRIARDRLMYEERLCHVLARVIGSDKSEGHRLATPEIMRPASKLNPFARARREVTRLYWQTAERLRSF